jgi:hypothetical protein
MKASAAPVTGRGSSLPPDFVRAAFSVAIARAARDGHRSECVVYTMRKIAPSA